MTDEVAVAWPLHTVDRQRLRELAGLPLPMIVPHSVAHPCANCGMTLAVGPMTYAHVRAGTHAVYCPVCMFIHVRRGVVQIVDLGNPDSRPEE